ncbi:MAG TPA: patatin-like phospholipase family protein [Aestuariivirgaceae bacterium]|nr:patatin-like phospholipase family protein [Aestuariivirgaceae bacterium]
MSRPRIGVALGGGGARGLAHIAMLEVFDELGVKPHRMAGTSMGALVGAAYASGLTAAEIRDHAELVLSNRVKLARRLLSRSDASLAALISFQAYGPMMVNGLRLTQLFFPPGVPERIEQTDIDFTVSATDYYDRKEIVLHRGPMREVVAASIAIPGLIAAPRINDRMIIDGAMVNPVPVDHVCRHVDLTVAIDVTGGPIVRRRRRGPSNTELIFGATQIMQRQISALRRKENPPDIDVEPSVDQFRVFDFFKIREILAAAQPAKERLKRQLGSALDGER